MSFSRHRPVTDSLPRNHGGSVFERGLAMVQKSVADSGTTSPIVPQELSPEVVKIFVDKFPLFDMIRKVPSNGLSHTFQQQVAFSNSTAPCLISETGSVSDDVNEYVRQTSNVAVFGTRRGISLKAQYAGQNAGGPGSDLAAREEEGGLLRIARDAQNVLLQYQEVFSSETSATSADGIYNALGFNGLRYIANQLAPSSNTVEVDITSTWTDQRVLTGVREVVNAIWDLGGEPDLIICNTTGSQALFADQQALMRYVSKDSMEIIPGKSVPAVNCDQGLLPVLVVPGGALGTWEDNSDNVFQDIWIVQTDVMEMPYLGNPLPSTLRIPIGTDGTLRELVIPFAMYGLAYLAPSFLGRVSLKTVNG